MGNYLRKEKVLFFNDVLIPQPVRYPIQDLYDYTIEEIINEIEETAIQSVNDNNNFVKFDIRLGEHLCQIKNKEQILNQHDVIDYLNKCDPFIFHINDPYNKNENYKINIINLSVNSPSI